MKRILLSGCALALVSCGSYQLSSIEGVERVKLTQKRYEKPQFYLKKFKPNKQSRSIASVADEVIVSNKRAYFLSLWKQYQSFQKVTNVSDGIQSCPQFHNDLIVHKKSLINSTNMKKSFNFSDVIVNSVNITSYPVLSLPYKRTDVYQYLSKKNAWEKSDEIVKTALIDHQNKMKQEIELMCEYGESRDYYVYENMISYYKSNEAFIYSYESLPAVMKIPVVSNMFLLDSLAKRNGEMSAFENSLLTKMNIPWFKNYLYEVSLTRNNKGKRYVLKD
jgi:hypothetical protein